jgi:hypothetical protein
MAAVALVTGNAKKGADARDVPPPVMSVSCLALRSASDVWFLKFFICDSSVVNMIISTGSGSLLQDIETVFRGDL